MPVEILIPLLILALVLAAIGVYVGLVAIKAAMTLRTLATLLIDVLTPLTIDYDVRHVDANGLHTRNSVHDVNESMRRAQRLIQAMNGIQG